VKRGDPGGCRDGNVATQQFSGCSVRRLDRMMTGRIATAGVSSLADDPTGRAWPDWMRAMTEAQVRWKPTVDEDGTSIGGDRFQPTVSGAQPGSIGSIARTSDHVMSDAIDSSQIEAIVSELQGLTRRPYGQYCGLAHALEIIGERWTLLIIRDLIVGPKRFVDLQKGLARIPVNILFDRLKELEQTGVAVRRPGADGASLYDLTEYGRELDDIVIRLGRWGARSLGEPRSFDIVTTDSMIMAMRTMFRPEAAQHVRADYVLRLGDLVIHARVAGGTLQAGRGALPNPDLIIETNALKPLLSGEVTPAEAIANGSVHITGEPALLDRFVEIFAIADP
jgi:DNA-binding HxlR family transcriptional regulator